MKKRFLTPLDQACSKDKLISQFSYIYFKDGFLYVSNGRVHIKQRMELHGFSDSLAKKLSGKCMHKDMFKLLNKQKDLVIEWRPSVLTKAHIIFKIAGSEVKCTIPNHSDAPGKGDIIRYINSIYDKFDLKETKSVALDPDTITLLRKVFVTKSTGFTFRFNTGDGGMLVTPNRNDYMEQAIITPLKLQGVYKKLK